MSGDITVLQEPFTLVACGVETTQAFGIGKVKNLATLIPVSYWMTFRSTQGHEFTIHRSNKDDLPDLELGATHWVRVQEKVS